MHGSRLHLVGGYHQIPQDGGAAMMLDGRAVEMMRQGVSNGAPTMRDV